MVLRCERRYDNHRSHHDDARDDHNYFDRRSNNDFNRACSDFDNDRRYHRTDNNFHDCTINHNNRNDVHDQPATTHTRTDARNNIARDYRPSNNSRAFHNCQPNNIAPTSFVHHIAASFGYHRTRRARGSTCLYRG